VQVDARKILPAEDDTVLVPGTALRMIGEGGMAAALCASARTTGCSWCSGADPFAAATSAPAALCWC
jgi:hypothetical protein